MGCNSDYLNQNSREQELQRAAKLLAFLYEQMGLTVPAKLREAAETYYCKDDFVAELCKAVHIPKARKFLFPTRALWLGLNDEERTLIRDLGVWAWEHEQADKERLEREEKEAAKAKARKRAAAKLSIEERKALGIKE